MSAAIRPVRPDDRAQWQDLWRAYLAFYETELPQAQYDLEFARLTNADRPDMRGLVAESGGRLVGLVHVIFHPHGWKPTDVAYLQDLYVAP